ncbi:MAG TPA: alpha/beta hydrolase [Gaiellaceae bacterium]|jgi:pimeloyl-ACP methyl ester carboxylesterase|nr:alpha/beta hydrolase [Gaiellaceae bacterium]
MADPPFEVATSDGVLHGHTAGRGAPALLLHGGPGVPDYLEGCAAELANLFTTIRYTQRGTAPSTVGPPYTIESHMEDAVAVLDAFELEQAWVIGHSWGGHLALHLAAAHPERFHGIVCVGTVGAFPEPLATLHENLRRDLAGDERARIAEIDEREEAGELTEGDVLERQAILWPHYFFDPATAPGQLTDTIGLECLLETSRSIEEHFELGALAGNLRKRVRMPALFAHGMADPLPVESSVDTAKHIRKARVARIPRAGHYPWIEQPGFLNRMLRGLIAQL